MEIGNVDKNLEYQFGNCKTFTSSLRMSNLTDFVRSKKNNTIRCCGNLFLVHGILLKCIYKFIIKVSYVGGR